MRRNSMDFAWNQHTRLDINCVYRNCSCSCRSNDPIKTICLNPCGKVTVVAINIWFGRRVISSQTELFPGSFIVAKVGFE